MKRLMCLGMVALLVCGLGGCAPTPEEQGAIALFEGVETQLTGVNSYDMTVRQVGMIGFEGYPDMQPNMLRGAAGSLPYSVREALIAYYDYTGDGSVDNAAADGTALSLSLAGYTEESGGNFDFYDLHYRSGVWYKKYHKLRYRDALGFDKKTDSYEYKALPDEIRQRADLDTFFYKTYFGLSEKPVLTADNFESWSVSPTADGGETLAVKLQADKLPEALAEALMKPCRERLTEIAVTPPGRHYETTYAQLLESVTPTRVELTFTFDSGGRPVRCDLLYDYTCLFGANVGAAYGHTRDSITFKSFGAGKPIIFPDDLDKYTDIGYVPKGTW